MTNPSHNVYEFASNEPPLLKRIDDFFTEAYNRPMNDKSLVVITSSVGHRIETLALNPKSEVVKGDNVRFLVSGGTLDFRGVNVSLEAQNVEVKYTLVKIILGPGDFRPISRLNALDLNMAAGYFLGREGEVATGGYLLPEEDVDRLLSSIQDCELSPEVPLWAQR
jgi:hypothetical protein